MSCVVRARFGAGMQAGSLSSQAHSSGSNQSQITPSQRFLESSCYQSLQRSSSSYRRRRPCQPRCALLTAAEFGGNEDSEQGFFQKLATVWNIFFPPSKKRETVSARAMAKSRLVQTLAEEEFGLTQKQISAIGQQIGRVLEDFVELDPVEGEEAPVLESKLEGRGRLKVMFKVRRVKPAAEDGWFGDEDGQEWSPYMAGDADYPDLTLEVDTKESEVSFEESLALRGQAEDTLEWLDSNTLLYHHHDSDNE